MIVLTIRTDKQEAEIGLYSTGSAEYSTEGQIAYQAWQAHRQLAETIHSKIEAMLHSKGVELADVGGVVAFRGPGSFTGLRIGLTVANAIAYGQGSLIVGSGGDDWIAAGIARLAAGESDEVVMPEYGSEANITMPRK